MAVAKPVKILAWVAGIVVVLIVASLITVRIMFPPEKVKAMVIPRAEKALGREVDFEGVGISLYPAFGAKIKGLTIANTTREGFSDRPFVALDEFVVGVKLLPLLSRKVQISQIVLREPKVLVEIDTSGAANWDDLAVLAKDTTAKEEAPKRKGPPALPIPITLERFVIQNGTVIYDDRQGGTKISLGEIDQQVGFDIDRQLQDITTKGELMVSEISLLSKEVARPLTGLAVTLSHDIGANLIEGKVRINDVRASLQEVFVSAKGMIENLNQDPTVDIAVATDTIALGDILAEIPVEMVPEIARTKATGTFVLDADVKGQMSDPDFPQVDGHMQIDDATIHYTELPKAVNDLNADIGFTTNSLDIATLELKLGDNPIGLKGTVEDFAEPLVDLALRAKVDLGDIKDIVPLPEGNSLEGRMRARLKAKGRIDPADPASADVRGDIGMKEVVVVTPAVAKPVRISGDTKLTSKQVTSLLEVVIGGSSMDVDARVTDWMSQVVTDTTRTLPRTNLDVTINSPRLNTDEFLVKVESAEGESTEERSESGDAAALPAAPLLPDMDLKADVRCDHLTYSGVDLRNMDMSASIVKDIVNVTMRSKFYGGRVNQKLHADTRNLQDISFRNELDIQDVAVGDVISDTKELLPETNRLLRELRYLDSYLTGTLNLDSDISGHGGTVDQIIATLAGDVLARLRDGTITGGPIVEAFSGALAKFIQVGDITFRDMKAKLHIQDGRVLFEEFDMPTNSGDFEVAGSVGFDASLDLKIRDRLTKAQSRPIIGAQKAGKDLAKGLLKGTPLEGASGMVEGAGVPVDDDGRVTTLVCLGGTVSKPKPTCFRFVGEGGSGVSSGKALKDRAAEELAGKKKQIEEQARKKAEELKRKAQAEARRKAQEAKRKAESQARKAAEEAKKKLQLEKQKEAEEAARKKAEEVKNKAKKKLKGLF